jgi:transcriptional regulator with XRE-family HTH domain
MDKKKALGQRIRLIRKRNSMTQEEFGKRLDVGKSTIINYESGKRSPDAGFLTRLIEQFDTDASWLLLGNIRSNSFHIKREVDNYKVQKLIEYLSIPSIRLLLVAESERLRVIFKDEIEEFEKEKIERLQINPSKNQKEIS